MRRVFLVFIATFVCAAVTDGNVPIVVETGDAKRNVMKLCSDASEQLRNGDVASAKRNINEALRIDPKLWPALYVRAEIFAREGKYALAIQDCNEALRKYADASKEFNSLIAMRPPTVILSRALSERAWFQATCPEASFRNGQQAVKDAKAACSIVAWKDEDMIDTLAAAYAETGDFDSAVRYAQQALAIKDISPRVAKRIQGHIALFQQHKPIRS